MIDVILIGIVKEEILVVQAGELVPFGGADDVSVLRKLDDVAHTGQHHPGKVAGLEYEIHGAVVEGIDLVLPVAAHDDHRYALEHRVFADLLEYGFSLVFWQRKIQQNKGQQVLALVYGLQRLLARLGIDDVILRL